VGELRHRPAEGLVDGHLLGGVGDVIVAADDVGDVHEGVVDGDHVVVDRDSGGNSACSPRCRADQNGVADRVGGELDRAADQIVEAERVVLNAEAHGERLSGGDVAGDGFLVQRAAAAGVDLGAMFRGGQFALGFKLLRRAEAAIGFARGEELFGVRGVEVKPLGLAVGAVSALAGLAGIAGAFVPVEAHPAQVFHELGFIAGFRALHVRVFNAEQEIAPGAAGKEPVVKGGTRIADMEQPGGGRSKPDAGFGDCHHYTMIVRDRGAPRYANASGAEE